MPETANTSDGFNNYSDWVTAYVRETLDALHEENCKWAKYLHETRYIYALYGALDGLSLSYSTTKYWFDMLVARTFPPNVVSSDLMHDWMLTPEGIAAMIAETLFMVGFSLLANIIDDEEQFEFRQHKIKLDKDEAVQDKHLYLKLDNGIIRCTAKNKKGVLETFILKEEYLDSHADAIKILVANKSEQFTREQLEKITEATAYRNNVQARLNLYVGWRYVRDMLKGLKNAYKGLRATMWALNWLKNDLRFLLFPAALTLGLLSGINRIWYRSMKDRRKLLQTNNKDLAFLIRELDSLSREEAEKYLSRIGSSHNYTRLAGLLSQVYGGLIDGLYLYMGALMLAPVSPLAFTFLVGCSTLFVAICIITRVYTEYEYDRKLTASELTVKLTISGKRLESLFEEIQYAQSLNDNIKLASLDVEINQEMAKFSTLEKERWKTTTLTPGLVVLSGLRDGLAAGGAVGSFMFAVVTINAMLLSTCPPAFVIACMMASLSLVIAGLVCAIIVNGNNNHSPRQLNSLHSLNDRVLALKKTFTSVQKELDCNINIEDARREIWDSMTLEPSPLFFWQEWAEVFRSLFSGLAKGQKAVDLTLNPLQEVDEAGHSHDSHVMIWATGIYSIVFGLVLALRSNAREFSEKNNPKPPPSAPPPSSPPPESPRNFITSHASTFFSTTSNNRSTKSPVNLIKSFFTRTHSDSALLGLDHSSGTPDSPNGTRLT